MRSEILKFECFRLLDDNLTFVGDHTVLTFDWLIFQYNWHQLE